MVRREGTCICRYFASWPVRIRKLPETAFSGGWSNVIQEMAPEFIDLLQRDDLPRTSQLTDAPTPTRFS